MDTGDAPAQFAEGALREVIARYESARETALRERDVSLRAFHAAGWRTTDLQRVTGYSRETIRLALNADARASVNAVRREASAARREAPWVLPRTLAELCGPTTGTVTLPRELSDLEGATYDLSRSGNVRRMYENVLHDARSVADLQTWINEGLLVENWIYLALAPRLRDLWDRRFAELDRRRW
jgi:hypothetical protein